MRCAPAIAPSRPLRGAAQRAMGNGTAAFRCANATHRRKRCRDPVIGGWDEVGAKRARNTERKSQGLLDDDEAANLEGCGFSVRMRSALQMPPGARLLAVREGRHPDL